MKNGLLAALALAMVPITAACGQGPTTEEVANGARAFCTGREYSPAVSSAKVIDSQISGNSAQVVADVQTRVLKAAPMCIVNHTLPCVIFDTGPCGWLNPAAKVGDTFSIKLQLMFTKWSSGWKYEGGTRTQ